VGFRDDRTDHLAVLFRNSDMFVLQRDRSGMAQVRQAQRGLRLVPISGRHFRGGEADLVAAPARCAARTDRGPPLAIYR